MKELRGKNALVTGAASGIGRSLAFGLAREGMSLYLADVDMDGLGKVKDELEGSGTKVFIGRCDVSKYEDVQAMADGAYSRMGPVDLLINNAGIGGAGLAEELDPGDWKPVIDVNMWSVIYSVRTFLPRMIERGTGHIVNVGSGAGVVGIPYHIQYVVSKFAVVGLTEALYSEVKHVHPGLDFSVICPSYLKTNIIDRTAIRLSEKFVVDASREELDKRAGEFSRAFWDKYTAGAPPVDKVVEKYIRGIKKNKLYIFDMPLLRVGLILKGLSDSLYKMGLRSEGRKTLAMIQETLAEMGIKVGDREI